MSFVWTLSPIPSGMSGERQALGLLIKVRVSGHRGVMTTLPNDPPRDDDDWSHEQTARDVESVDPEDLESFDDQPAEDPDNLDAYTEEELEVFADEDIYDKVSGTRVSYPGEDLDDEEEDYPDYQDEGGGG